MKIPEKYLRHIWRNLYLNLPLLKTVDGKSISIISTGSLNTNEGADFYDAKVIIDGEEKSGDIEIHSKTSDWKHHRHSQNARYERVILHVVYNHDSTLPNTPPVLELSSHLNDSPHKIISTCIRDEAEYLNRSALHCYPLLSEIDDSIKVDWIRKLSFQRFDNKVQRFKEKHQHPDELIYQGLCRALGYSENKSPMEKLSKMISYHDLQRYADKSFTERRSELEGIFFSLSGLIPIEKTDDYMNQLGEIFSKSPFSTYVPLSADEWIFFRLRPSNFPTVRIAALCEILSKELTLGFSKLAIKILDMTITPKRKIMWLESIFCADASGYWQTHYQFGKTAKVPIRNLVGKTRASEIVLNTLLPVLYLLFEKQGLEEKMNEVKELYELYPKTLSSKISNMVLSELLGESYQVKSAMIEQGLIELQKNYCESFRCLECDLGKKIFNP